MKKYLVIGNGVAGTTAAGQIRTQDREGEITVITDEDLPFYDRLRLNAFIAGEASEPDLVLKKRQWYREQRITLITSSPAVDGDPRRRVIATADGREFPYDRLLLATGSHAFLPSIRGVAKKGVFSLRTIEDARALKTFAQQTRRAILIGGGLLGLETGNALRKLGKDILVVEFSRRLLPRQLDNEGARRLQSILAQRGFSFELNAATEEIIGTDDAEAITLKNGKTLRGRMIIISAGVRANLELARSMGVPCDRGVKVDDHLRTSVPGVFAAGDAAEFQGPPYGIWPAGFQQGKIAGANMAGGDIAYQGSTLATTLKVAGIELAAAGDIDAENRHESVVAATETRYKKIVLDQQGRIIGYILLGDTKEINRLNTLMAGREDITRLKEDILSA